MPKITEAWIQSLILGKGESSKPLSISVIESRFVKPFVRRNGLALLDGKALTESEKRSLYAQQLRDHHLDAEIAKFLTEPSKFVVAQTECREDHRVI